MAKSETTRVKKNHEKIHAIDLYENNNCISSFFLMEIDLMQKYAVSSHFTLVVSDLSITVKNTLYKLIVKPRK